jgi:hypothetical protein
MSPNNSAAYNILGVPYTGPGVETCALTQNKDSIKILSQIEGIAISNFTSFDKIEWEENKGEVFERINKELRYPLLSVNWVKTPAFRQAVFNTAMEVVSLCHVTKLSRYAFGRKVKTIRKMVTTPFGSGSLGGFQPHFKATAFRR